MASIIDSRFPASAALDSINQALQSDDQLRKTAIKKANAVYGIVLTNEAGEDETWHIDLQKKGDVGKGLPEGVKTTVTLKMSNATFDDLASGKANAQKLYLGGKVKRVSGDIMKASGLETAMKLVLKQTQQVKPKL